MWFKILVRKTKNNLFLICYDSTGKALTNVSGGMTGSKGSARLSPAAAFSAGKLLVEKLVVLDKFKDVLSMEPDDFLYQMAALKKNLKYGIRQRNYSRVLEQGAFLKRYDFGGFLMSRLFFLREFFFLANYSSVLVSRGQNVKRKLGKFYNLFLRSGFSKVYTTFREGSFYVPLRHPRNLVFPRIVNKGVLVKRPSFTLNQILKVRSLGLLPFRNKLRDSSFAFWDVFKERRDAILRRKRVKRRLQRRNFKRIRRRRRRRKSFLRSDRLLFLRRSFSSSVKERLVAKVLLGSRRSAQLFPFLRTLNFRRRRLLLGGRRKFPFQRKLIGNFARVLPLLGVSKLLYLRPSAFYSVGFVKRYRKASAFVRFFEQRRSLRFIKQRRSLRFIKRSSFFKVIPPFWRRRFGIKFLLVRKKLPVYHFSQVREGLKPFVFLVASTRMDQNVRAAMRGVITHFPKVLRIFGFFRVPHNGVRAKKQRRL